MFAWKVDSEKNKTEMQALLILFRAVELIFTKPKLIVTFHRVISNKLSRATLWKDCFKGEGMEPVLGK